MPSKEATSWRQRTMVVLVVVLVLMVLVLVLVLVVLRKAPGTVMLCTVIHSSAALSTMHATIRLWPARTQMP